MTIPAASFPIRTNVIDAQLARGTAVRIKPVQWNDTFSAYDVELMEIIDVRVVIFRISIYLII